jgi:large subunit ribosomal protein L2
MKYKNKILFFQKQLRKKPLLKKKLIGLVKSSGRNNSGKITVHHKGGGHKRKYRNINFYRIYNAAGIVCSIEYDPNRNANIASFYDKIQNNYSYILAPKNLKVGDIIKSGLSAEPKLGHSLPLSNIPVGSYIHNIIPKTFKPAQISRSAGTFSRLKKKTLNSALLELSSGEQRLVSTNCYASIGIVSNQLFRFSKLKKAGQSRWKNIRPTVRGVAMNPIDHPHGGGEGKKSGNNLSPWGKNNKQGNTGKSRNKLIIKFKNE